ncbi:hypothetical protein GCM10010187_47270 [Actinomadura coerulea]|nr:hypothetical protein GCM10010187_47270 [Actinomadura coerulea]
MNPAGFSEALGEAFGLGDGPGGKNDIAVLHPGLADDRSSAGATHADQGANRPSGLGDPGRGGPGRVTVRAVSARLQVLPRALYNYVADRRDLFAEMVAVTQSDRPQPPGWTPPGGPRACGPTAGSCAPGPSPCFRWRRRTLGRLAAESAHESPDALFESVLATLVVGVRAMR